jgi:polysaccharide deacetylase 2 family uncharacterized protein YibQ
MDDLGRDPATARALLAIDIPVTFAILPGEPHAARVAEIAYGGGREIMVHIPMEPLGYPAVNPGDDALLVAMEAEEIRQRVRGYLQEVPHASGGNNHMGSRFTQSSEGMAAVLGQMRQSDLFFVDSLTTGKSVGMAEAHKSGVPAIARDLFLDNVQDVGQISREIRKLTDLAVRRGHAVGICHPYPETLEALRHEVSYIRQRGVEVVSVSRLLPR